MEIFDSNKPYTLHAFRPEFSEEELRVDIEVIPENGVEFYLNPTMGVDEKNNMYVIGLKFGFMKGEEPCSTPVYSNIQFLYDSEERVFIKEEKGDGNNDKPYKIGDASENYGNGKGEK